MPGVTQDGNATARPLDKSACAGSKPVLHKSQAAVLEAVSRYYREQRAWPSRREIAALSGVTLGGPLDLHLTRLRDAGLLVIIPRVARGVRLTGTGAAWVRESVREQARKSA